MSENRIKEFTAKCRKGITHNYEITPLDVDVQIEIALAVAPILGGPLGSFIGSMVQNIGPQLEAMAAEGAGSLMDIELAGWADLAKVFGQIEWSTVGAELGDGVSKLKPKLIRRVLAQCSRDGKPLSHKANFDNAYERNPYEMWMAMRHVLVIEGFVDFGFTSTNAGTSEGEQDQPPQ